ncbi:MAG: HlyD family efflux transporter periplasmic adaptor subunit [Rhizomicrobium sp.]
MFARLMNAIDSFYERIAPGFWLRMKPSYQWAACDHDHCGDVDRVELDRASQDGDQHGKRGCEDGRDGDAAGARRGADRDGPRGDRDGPRPHPGAACRRCARRNRRYGQGHPLRQGPEGQDGRRALRDRRQRPRRQGLADAGDGRTTSKELEVAKELYAQGFRSKTQLAQSQAAYEAAKAGESTMGIQLSNTKIRAPFDGYVDDRYVDVGDYMKAGDRCEMVYAPEPFLAVGAVSEHEVGQIKIGDPANATLVTGETVSGKVRFVADRADATTRTFRVEVELPQCRQHAARRRQRRYPYSGKAGRLRSYLPRHFGAERCRRRRRARGAERRCPVRADPDRLRWT